MKLFADYKKKWVKNLKQDFAFIEIGVNNFFLNLDKVIFIHFLIRFFTLLC